MWEIEKGPDGSFDLLRNGRPEHYGLTAEQVREHFAARNIDMEEVEGSWLL